MVDVRLINAIWILVMIYLIYRFFVNKKRNSMPDNNANDYLNSEKYKVKGQYDN